MNTILQNENAYQQHTSPRDYQAGPNLYKLIQISLSELKLNLVLISATDSET